MRETQPKKTNRTAEGAGIQVLARAAEILRLLKQDTSGLSLGKIAKRVELPRSTVQRIINALVAEDLVSIAGDSGGYVIGPEIVALAQAAKLDITRLLHPHLENLSRRTGETVDLAIFRQDRMVFVDQVVGSHRLRAVSSVNDSFPMTVTANGKAVSALLSPERVYQIHTSERAAGVTDTALEAFEEELNHVRSTGFALDINEHTPGISAVGVAFTLRETFYAVSIPAPSHRFEMGQNSFVEHLMTWLEEVMREVPEITRPHRNQRAA